MSQKPAGGSAPGVQQGFGNVVANDYSTNPGKELDARLTQLGKPHRLKIYPPIGRTADDGHNFPLTGVSIWEPDVFGFLDEHVRK